MASVQDTSRALPLSFDIRDRSFQATRAVPRPSKREGTKNALTEDAEIVHSVSYQTPRINSAAEMRSSNPSSIVSFLVRVSSKAFLMSVELLLDHRS